METPRKTYVGYFGGCGMLIGHYNSIVPPTKGNLIKVRGISYHVREVNGNQVKVM